MAVWFRRTCPSCSAEVGTSAIVCPHCGHEVPHTNIWRRPGARSSGVATVFPTGDATGTRGSLVLVADDDAALLQLVSTWLRDGGYEVVTTESGYLLRVVECGVADVLMKPLDEEILSLHVRRALLRAKG